MKGEILIDLAIIGGGPAGLSAGLYATRGGISNVVLFDSGMPGGQIMNSSEIENYPGVKDIVSGIEFMEPWQEQCFRFGLKHNMNEVKMISKSKNIFKIHLSSGEVLESKAAIVCTGGYPKRSNIKGESDFFGKGVSVCATCDGFFYKNMDVAVVGGGDTALEEAIYLTRMCKKVYLIHRRDTFKASPITLSHVKANPKIELLTSKVINEIKGDSNGVTSINISDLKTNNELNLDVKAVFVFVGYDVNTKVLLQENNQFLCDVTQSNQVKVDLCMRTSIEGLFAAGDVRESALKQVVIAAGDGAVAALSAIEYLQSLSNHE